MWGFLCTKLQNSAKKLPPSTPPFHTGSSAPRPKIKIPLTPFCLPCQILSKMVWLVPIASKTREEIDFLQNAWVQARAYLIGTGQVYYRHKSYQPSNPWKFHSNWPHHSKINQNFPIHGITLTTRPPGTLRGASNQNTKNIALLKCNFGNGTFYKELTNSQKKFCPPWGPHPCNPEIGPQPQN